jgi:hypothetical protein
MNPREEVAAVLKYHRHFDTYREADEWIVSNGIMQSCVHVCPITNQTSVTLEGEWAKRGADVDYPIDPDGFRLRVVERFA